ncbi:dehydrogenase/reductase SDR family member 11-like [Apostichopus japonicus]|uniref:dehydrogenase/reductase SDR family member 11-like n=1 Tax=Stichopus japonicus TaxID=307972 RepID=UPI003AB49193
MHRWVGRVAMVTGAANGIGAATAKMLVDNGMKVAAVNWMKDFKACEDLADNLNKGQAERRLLPILCDISKEDQVLSMFKQIRAEFGRLDVCVNSAGVGPVGGDLIEGNTESWKLILDVNVIGLSLCTREAIRLMRERTDNSGYVIHIGSYCGHRIPNNHQLHFYAASKHAVKVLTEGLRRELRAINSNIRISSISPGAVDTQFGSDIITDLRTRPSVSSEDVADQVLHCLKQPQHVQILDEVILPTYQAG